MSNLTPLQDGAVVETNSAMYFVAPAGFAHGAVNPFDPTGSFGDGWSGFFILDRTDGYGFTGTAGTDLFTYQFSKTEPFLQEKLADFIRYENSHSRKVIVSGPKEMGIPQFIDYALSSTPPPHKIRNSDQRYVVHSTTRANGESILKEGRLRSPYDLKQGNRNLDSLRFLSLGEPKDYADHIWFADLGAIGPEVVVASNQMKAYVADVQYEPGYRFYFDNHKIITAGKDLRVLSGTRVLKQIDLDGFCVMHVGTKDLEPQSHWMPSEFTVRADQFFWSRMRTPEKECNHSHQSVFTNTKKA